MLIEHGGILQGKRPHSDSVAFEDPSPSRLQPVSATWTAHFRHRWHDPWHVRYARKSNGLATIPFAKGGLRLSDHESGQPF